MTDPLKDYSNLGAYIAATESVLKSAQAEAYATNQPSTKAFVLILPRALK